MESLETELDRARSLDESMLADAIESFGFECTRCGACCTADEPVDTDAADDAPVPHTATVFPDEVRELQRATDREWRDVARPMPYGLEQTDDAPGDDHELEGSNDLEDDGLEGETFEWALQTDGCGDCVFYEESDGVGACTVHADRPLICATYPFSVALGGTSQPMGDPVDREGMVRAHECEGLGRDISRADAEALAGTLKDRAVRELEEAIAVRGRYEPVETGSGDVVVHDSEGAKRQDGSRHRE